MVNGDNEGVFDFLKRGRIVGDKIVEPSTIPKLSERAMRPTQIREPQQEINKIQKNRIKKVEEVKILKEAKRGMIREEKEEKKAKIERIHSKVKKVGNFLRSSPTILKPKTSNLRSTQTFGNPLAPTGGNPFAKKVKNPFI